jgi:hypothetical protein
LPLTDRLAVRPTAADVVRPVVVGPVVEGFVVVGEVVAVDVRVPALAVEVGPAGAAVRSSP